jgi:methyl-accepting chemotaxis protein
MSLLEKMLAAALKAGAKEVVDLVEDAEHRIQQTKKRIGEIVKELDEIAESEPDEVTKREGRKV